MSIAQYRAADAKAAQGRASLASLRAEHERERERLEQRQHEESKSPMARTRGRRRQLQLHEGVWVKTISSGLLQR